MAYGNRGGYGNQRNGGGSYGNRGGSYGGRSGGYQRGGGNRGGSGGGDHKYLRSSSLTKTLIFDAENGRKERIGLEPGITEEIAISLTADKAQDLIRRINDAVNDQQGDGGIRLTMYCQHKINQDTQEEFDGASLLIVGKFPPKDNGQQRGRGGFNNNRSGGRRDYGGNDQGRANSGTNQSGAMNRGNQTQDYQQDGNTQDAQNDASHSNDNGYTEQTGW